VDETFHIYLMGSASGVLYVGVTSNLVGRVLGHKQKRIPSFTAKYNVTKLLWYQAHGSAASAIAREKEIKAWRRAKKVALIETMNPKWEDLSGALG
jgi:putative endonuclease